MVAQNAASHKLCTKCHGEKKSKFLKCEKNECEKICHVECLPVEMQKVYKKLKVWFCDPECGLLDPPITINESIKDPEKTETHQSEGSSGLKQKEKNEEKVKSRLIAKYQTLKDALQTSNELVEHLRETHAINMKKALEEIDNLKAQLASAAPPDMERAKQNEASNEQEPDESDESDVEYDELIASFNKTILNSSDVRRTSEPSKPKETLNVQPTQYQQPVASEGLSNATLVYRERVRPKREKDENATSIDPHIARSQKELSRLELARQHIDDPEANPELVMETLRRKYYHPNQAVTLAFREIIRTETVHYKRRKPPERLVKASRIFDCMISSVGDPTKKFQLKDVVTMKNFSLPAQSQDPVRLKEAFPHLNDVPIPFYESSHPQLLIGLEQRHLMAADKVIKHPNCPIVAELTSLGWIVSGAIRPKRDKRVVLQSCITREDSQSELKSGELKICDPPTRHEVTDAIIMQGTSLNIHHQDERESCLRRATSLVSSATQ